MFGLDYTHIVYLGVVQRLLLYWKGPVGPIHVRLGSKVVAELSHKLTALCQHIPCEFARRPVQLQMSYDGRQQNGVPAEPKRKWHCADACE